jgi:hypothetical protein
VRAAIAIGIVLGVISRVEETTGFSAGISSDSAWCATAFLVASPLRGIAALSAANAGYYAWIALTQPALPLEAAAGPVHVWLGLGVLTGAVFGAAGGAWRAGPRFLAALPLALVMTVEGGDALRGGAATDGIGLLAGVALAAASAPSWRRAAVAATALLAVAATGAGAAFLP